MVREDRHNSSRRTCYNSIIVMEKVLLENELFLYFHLFPFKLQHYSVDILFYFIFSSKSRTKMSDFANGHAIGKFCRFVV